MTEAENFLIGADQRFKPLIERFGPCELVHPLRGVNIFESLLSSILYQQLSGKAATTIKNRLYDLFPNEPHPPADALVTLTIDEFRAVGVSRQKAGYIQDLAKKANTLPNEIELKTLSDEEIIARLTVVKGIGKWSAEMMLMFTLGRPDVWPIDDLGIQEGIKRFYGLEERPKAKQMSGFAESWRPYRSTAAWYLWRILES